MSPSEMESLGEDEVRLRLERGDFVSYWETVRIKSWLRSKKKEREFLSKCKKAEMASAFLAWREARRANTIAAIAVMIAAIAAKEEIRSFIGGVLDAVWP